METIKGYFIAIGSVLSVILGVAYIPVMLMVACSILDYITGIAASIRQNDTLSSYRSIWGIVKKIFMWLLVYVGYVVDRMIVYMIDVLGMHDIPIRFLVACVVAVWIVCNELISILENMINIGVDMPPFLMPLVRLIQEKTEEVTNNED